MINKFKKSVILFLVFFIPLTFFAQKDVTQFLDLPVDGYKNEMIEKLKSKGFVQNKYSKDVFDGEFNGTDVNIFIGTNNNKVYRIMVSDANTINETDIKIRFNNLIKQFVNNKRYLVEADSTVAKYFIPKDEDISYEISINRKRYEAIFNQKSLKYDSLIKEKDLLYAKDSLNDKEKQRISDLLVELIQEYLNSLDKKVWFMINEENGKYRIYIYYDNELNRAKGEGL